MFRSSLILNTIQKSKHKGAWKNHLYDWLKMMSWKLRKIMTFRRSEYFFRQSFTLTGVPLKGESAQIERWEQLLLYIITMQQARLTCQQIICNEFEYWYANIIDNRNLMWLFFSIGNRLEKKRKTWLKIHLHKTFFRSYCKSNIGFFIVEL